MNMDNPALEQHLDQLSEGEEIEQFVKTQLKDLAEVREEITKFGELIKEAQKELDDTPEQLRINRLLAELNTFREAENSLKTYVTNDALRLSELSGYEDRKPVSGVEVKQFATVKILDDVAAKRWAAQSAPDILSISLPKFKKVAKVLALEFVEIETEYRAQVASDLSEYLDE